MKNTGLNALIESFLCAFLNFFGCQIQIGCRIFGVGQQDSPVEKSNRQAKSISTCI